MKKVALYCRTSTQRQEKDETIKTQLFKLREIYKKENIVKEYIDDGYSGTYLSRPAFNSLREDAEKGLFNVIALYSNDRLSRNDLHQRGLIEEFQKQGIKIEILGQELKTDTPADRFQVNVMGSISQYEREMITQRMRDGRYRKIKNQEFAVGTPPYGYKISKENEKARLEINLREAKIVKEIFRIYIEEKSLGKTAERIYEVGYRSRTNKSFSGFMIGHFLKNETYIGNFYFGKTIACEPKKSIKVNKKSRTPLTSRKYKPREEWVLIKVPAIIDEDTFNRVQEIRKEMARSSLKPTRNYLLQGLIKCPYCNFRYIGKMKSKSHRLESPNGSPFSYICPRRAGKRRPDDHKCSSREISTKRLDSYVWGYVSALIQDKDKVINSVRLLKEKRKSEKDFNQRIYDSLITEKAKIKEAKNKIFGLYAYGEYKKEDLDYKLAELDNQENDLEKQIKEAEKKLLEIKETHSLEEEIERTCLEYQGKIKNANFELKRRILNRWVKEIVLPKEGGIKIVVRIPQTEKSLSIPSSIYSGCYPTRVSTSEEV